MSRPRYENEQTLAEEQRFRSIVENKHPEFVLKKLPISYGYDFACLRERDGSLAAFIEYRQRNYTFQKLQKLGGYRISLQKWERLHGWAERFNVKCLFYVHLADCLPTQFYRYQIHRGTIGQMSLVWWDNSKRGDWQDNELAVVLPCEDLELIDFIT
jgi:hypothetical protein